jgi:hypothetical protein
MQSKRVGIHTEIAKIAKERTTTDGRISSSELVLGVLCELCVKNPIKGWGIHTEIAKIAKERTTTDGRNR